MRARGFTLLEVLVAISILGLGLTMILSSQAGLFASNQRSERVTVASNLLRCKMSEVEIELVKNGFPVMDQTDSGECCEDESDTKFSCEWATETIELPQPATFDENTAEGSAEGGFGKLSDLAGASAPGAVPGAPGGLGALGALMGMGQTPGTELGQASSFGDLAGMMTSDVPGGGMEAMAMSLVYPSLKPMLEASIRKVTVRVRWNEGSKKQELVGTQYITNPQTFDPGASDATQAAMEQLGLGQDAQSGETQKGSNDSRAKVRRADSARGGK